MLHNMDKKPSLLTLALLISLAAVGALFFTPGIPHMATDFNISPQITQFTIILYLIGYAVGQLFYGPISKKYGRKFALYIGLAIAVIGSLLCALSKPFDSFWLLLFARFILAIGAASGYALTFTIIADSFSPEDSKHVIPKVAMGLSVFPFGSVIIGGFLVQFFGWASTFYFLIIYCFFLIYLTARLPETGSPSKEHSIHPLQIIRDYTDVLKYGRLSVFSLAIAGCVGIFYIFAGTAPFLAIHGMGIKSYQYGLLSAIVTVGFVLGALITSHIAKKLEGTVQSVLGICINTIAMLIMAWLFFFKVENIWTLFLPMFFITWGIMFIWSNCAALATKDIPDKAHAAGVMSFINVAGGVVGVLIISIFRITNPIVMPIVFLVITIFQICMIIYARKKQYS